MLRVNEVILWLKRQVPSFQYRSARSPRPLPAPLKDSKAMPSAYPVMELSHQQPSATYRRNLTSRGTSLSLTHRVEDIVRKVVSEQLQRALSLGVKRSPVTCKKYTEIPPIQHAPMSKRNARFVLNSFDWYFPEQLHGFNI